MRALRHHADPAANSAMALQCDPGSPLPYSLGGRFLTQGKRRSGRRCTFSSPQRTMWEAGRASYPASTLAAAWGSTRIHRLFASIG